MLTTIEIPGLYVQPEKDFYIAFDNIDVKKIKSSETELILQIKNPTPVDANVSILEDKNIVIALNENTMYGSKKIMLKAGETRELSFIKSKPH